MPQDITDVNTWTSPIVAPADGDPEGASSVLTPLQGLANRSFFIKSLIGAANGIAPTDSTARVAAANVRNGIIAVETGMNASFSLSSLGFSQPSGMSISLAALAGDLILVLLQFTASNAGVKLLAQAQDNGGGFSLVGGGSAPCQFSVPSGAPASQSSGAGVGLWVVGASGTTIVEATGEALSGTVASNAATITVVQFRP